MKVDSNNIHNSYGGHYKDSIDAFQLVSWACARQVLSLQSSLSFALDSWSVGEDFAAADSGHRKPTAIILEPSKDLAEQTHDFMVRFKQYLTQPQLRCELLIGGTNPKQGSRALEEGVDIITGTPGNIHTHIPGHMIHASVYHVSHTRYQV